MGINLVEKCTCTPSLNLGHSLVSEQLCGEKQRYQSVSQLTHLMAWDPRLCGGLISRWRLVIGRTLPNLSLIDLTSSLAVVGSFTSALRSSSCQCSHTSDMAQLHSCQSQLHCNWPTSDTHRGINHRNTNAKCAHTQNGCHQNT